MAVVSLHKTEVPQKPEVAELVARAHSLIPLLRDKAREVELAGRLPADVIHEVAALDLLKVTKPARFGGFEYGPSTLLRVGFELGQGCGSTAWCSMIANCCAWYMSYMPLQAQQDVWGNTPDVLVASGGVPTGKAEAVEGGYKTWGTWTFASNCDNSQWYLNGSMIMGADGKPVGPAWFLIPREDLEIDHDSWDVTGLKGTGSKNLFVKEPIFVPEHRMMRLEDLISGNTPGLQVPNNPLASYYFTTFGGVALVAPLLGMAQGALDGFCETMRSKLRAQFGPAGASRPLSAAESPFNQEKAGRAEVMIASALTYLLAQLEAAEAKIASGQELNTTDRIRVRRACTFASRQAVAVVNLLAECSGASSANVAVPMQRYWRDVNAGARHMGLDDTAIYTAAGQHLFGLKAVGIF